MECVAISSFRGSSRPRDQTGISCISCIGRQILYHCATWEAPFLTLSSVQSLSRVQLFATPVAVACQAPVSMGFARQEYWSGLPFSPSGDLPDSGSNLSLFCLMYCLVVFFFSFLFFTTSATWEALTAFTYSFVCLAKFIKQFEILFLQL